MRKRIGLFLALGAFAFLLFQPSRAAAQPGDATDPLVSRAYVDERLAPLTAELAALRAEVAALRAELSGGAAELLAPQPEPGTPEPSPQPASPGAVPYEAVFVPEGYSVIAGSGTEFVLRGGAAVAVTGINGLLDATAGADITDGAEIPLNHLLIAPADDGRGLRVLRDAYLMIKGSYNVVG